MSQAELVETILGLEDEDYLRAICDGRVRLSGEQLALAMGPLHRHVLATWPADLLESYLDDVRQAATMGKSLTVQKAAFVEGIALPNEGLFRPAEIFEHQEFVTKISLIWETRARMALPYFTSNLGPLVAEEDTPGCPSFETDLLAELSCYSIRTLRRYVAFVTSCWNTNRNPQMEAYDLAARDLGFVNAKTAEVAHVRL